MNAQLLDIKPRELKFIIAVKKQSSSSIQLFNNTTEYVAFKVKTTSPKKYCVRPNVGIIIPKSTRDFTVTMQAPRSAPVDMTCKDKFLIQSTVVPCGTTDEDITSSMFVKDGGRYIEETKLRVVLTSPPCSPVLSPLNGPLKQDLAYEAIPKDHSAKVQSVTPYGMVVKAMEEQKFVNGEELKLKKREELTPRKVADLKSTKDHGINAIKNVDLKATKTTKSKASKDSGLNTEKDLESKETKIMSLRDSGSNKRKDVDLEETKSTSSEDSGLNIEKDVGLKETKITDSNRTKELELNLTGDAELNRMKDTDFSGAEITELQPTLDSDLKRASNVETRRTEEIEDLKMVTEVKELKSKLNEIELKLRQAELTISKLTEDRGITIQEREKIKAELENLRIIGVRQVQVGFPFLFVCMVALVSVVVGYILHP